MGGVDSKLYYRRSILKIGDTDLALDGHDEFWKELFSYQGTSADILVLFPASDVRGLCGEKPQNIQMIVRKCVANIRDAVTSHEKEQSTPMGVAMTSVRILTRVVPVMNEGPFAAEMEPFFWHAADGEKCMAEQIVGLLLDLSFLPGFTSVLKRTVDKNAKVLAKELNGPEPELVWEFGAGMVTNYVSDSTDSMDINRRDILRCLIALVADSLYLTSGEMQTKRSKWAAFLAGFEHKHSATLFFSVLNSGMSWNPQGPFGGWQRIFIPLMFAQPVVTGRMSGFAGIYEDYKEQMVVSSLQTLLLLLDYRPPGTSGKADESNIYINLLRSLNRAEDFDIIFEGLAQLLNNVWEAENTTIPNTLYKIDCYQEVLVLFWKVIEENKGFLRHVLAKQDINRILVPLLYFVYQGRRDPTKVGLVHVCTFTLLLLSGEREFAVALNRPFNKKLPLDLPTFTGCHADLLFVVFHKLVVNGPEKLDSLYNCILTTVCNVSPYIKTLGQVPSVKFLNLFELFASKKFIESGPNNYQYAFLIIEALSNFVQYQYEGNHQLVYAVIRRRTVFEDLARVPDEPSGKEPAVEGEDAAPAPGHWVPSVAWYREWKSKIPANINTILRLVAAVTPAVENLCENTSVVGEREVLAFLKDFTVVGLLPVPHPILVRRYTANDLTDIWFSTYIWGVVYLRNQEPPLFDGEQVRLFSTIRTSSSV